MPNEKTKLSNQNSTHVGGKAARARAARNGIKVVTDLNLHRPSGGAPIASDLEECEYYKIVVALEEIEKIERMKFRPHMVDRKDVPMDNHGSMIVHKSSGTRHDHEEGQNHKANEKEQKSENGSDREKCDLSEHSLRDLNLQIISTKMTPPSPNAVMTTFKCLTYLDLSRNELWTLPPSVLRAIPNLQHLDISRNWFAELPKSLVHLTQLESLNASHNMLRSSKLALLLNRFDYNPAEFPDRVCKSLPNDDEVENKNKNQTSITSVGISILQSLRHLKKLDLTFNQKCNHQNLQTKIEKEIPSVDVIMTINFPRPDGAFIGASAAERDPSLLRSQLEPWSTTTLRRRLVADFGEDASSPDDFDRSDVMERLLELYTEEAEYKADDVCDNTVVTTDTTRGSARVSHVSRRKVVHSSGILLEESLRNELLLELKSWKDGWVNKNLERTSICAENYMILTSPSSWEPLGRKKRQKAEAKLKAHKKIWDLAQTAMASVDEEFSNRYTALAVTNNFQGSPHIDRQNVGPFYGLSLGDFCDGTGGIMVECSARVVANVNTKNRLGRVDGRFPHWVAPYDVKNEERFSLIFYQTMGEYQKVGPAIFDLTKEHASGNSFNNDPNAE